MQIRFSSQPYVSMAKFGNGQTSETDKQSGNNEQLSESDKALLAAEIREQAANAEDGGKNERAAALYQRANELDPRN